MRVDELDKFKRLLALDLDRFDLAFLKQDVIALRNLVAFYDLVSVDRSHALNDLLIRNALARGFVYLSKPDLRA